MLSHWSVAAKELLITISVYFILRPNEELSNLDYKEVDWAAVVYTEVLSRLS
jgi:hypothetical protein